MNPIPQATENTMKHMSDEVTSEQLITDFKVVVADAEALLKETPIKAVRSWPRYAPRRKSPSGS